MRLLGKWLGFIVEVDEFCEDDGFDWYIVLVGVCICICSLRI